tara:strand:+ start:372 stop:1088 length:717 start_codon:yes stop_codon:yes gene_type:complete
MFFKSLQFVKGVKIFGYGLASFFLYSLTNQLYLKYTKKNISNEDDESDESKEIPYSYQYYEEFEKFPVIELSKERIKSLLNNVLFETTPKGNVIMYYDYDKESFNYYCDVKDISYLYLETVVRKYAINFNCKKLVVNIQKEIENATNKIKESEIKDNDVVKKDTGVFASFKSYNRKGTGGSKNPKKKYIVCEFANRYSYCGKVSEYSFLKKEDYKVEKHQDKMDYKTFKKLMDEKNKS